MANLRASPAKSAFLGIATVVLVVIVVRQVWHTTSTAQGEPVAGVAVAVSAGDGSGGTGTVAPISRLKRPLIDAVVRRDPFSPSWLAIGAKVPAADQAGQPEALRLQATLTTGASASYSAMISGVVVHVGDVVAGYRVVSITDRRVELNRDGERIALMMH